MIARRVFLRLLGLAPAAVVATPATPDITLASPRRYGVYEYGWGFRVPGESPVETGGGLDRFYHEIFDSLEEET